MPQIHVYCDESRPEALAGTAPDSRYLCIGSVWSDQSNVRAQHAELRAIRRSHGLPASGSASEFKWSKISPSSTKYYVDLVNFFFRSGEDISFRAIIVDNQKVDLSFHGNDAELGFYKFYYQLLSKRIYNDNTYRIFCDQKENRDPSRIRTLERCLRGNGNSETVLSVQAIRSHEAGLLQLADLLLGVTSCKFNRGYPASPAKALVMRAVESGIGKEITPTPLSERKFNVFKIDPGRRW